MKVTASYQQPILNSTTTEPSRDYIGLVRVEGTRAEVEWWIKEAMKIGDTKEDTP